MASVRYIILAACQNTSLYAQAGWESEAAAWIEKQGDRPCAYVGYGQGNGVAGFDNVSVVFGGSDPRAALRRVRESLERSLEFRSERQTEVSGFPALEMTARSKRRVYGVFGGGVRPVPPVPPTDLPLYFEAVNSNSTVALTSTLETAPDLEYSTDGTTWREWQHTTAEGTHTFDTLTLTAVGDKVYLRGVNSAGFLDIENNKVSLFSMSGKIAAGGNTQSLIDGDTPTLVAKTMPFFSDFIITEQPSDVLTQAPALPATTLSENCYAGMFDGCTGLTQAPALPATTLADGCYAVMFDGCTGLTQAPALPATTLAENCYADMFTDCTFNMSDDGTTFNFQCGATLPQTVGEVTYSTPEELAVWMGNTNGFTNP